jgi:hypothetical protein
MGVETEKPGISDAMMLADCGLGCFAQMLTESDRAFNTG